MPGSEDRMSEGALVEQNDWAKCRYHETVCCQLVARVEQLEAEKAAAERHAEALREELQWVADYTEPSQNQIVQKIGERARQALTTPAPGEEG